MDWKILLTSILLIIGWFVVNWLAALRERKSKKREVRVRYLIEAYRAIASAANRGSQTTNEQKNHIESAIEDIQLLGDKAQIDALNKMIAEGSHNFTEILQLLRAELRKELNLEEVTDRLLFYRMERKK